MTWRPDTDPDIDTDGLPEDGEQIKPPRDLPVMQGFAGEGALPLPDDDGPPRNRAETFNRRAER